MSHSEAGSQDSGPGIRPHRAGDLPACDVVVKHGLRVTTPARTLLDLAAVAPRATLERLVEEAQVQNAVAGAELVAMAERGDRQARRARCFARSSTSSTSRCSRAPRPSGGCSELCRSAALPLPQHEHALGGVGGRCGVGRAAPRGRGRRLSTSTAPRAKFERDRRKDADLMLAGYRVLRVTWHRLDEASRDEVIALLAAALVDADARMAGQRRLAMDASVSEVDEGPAIARPNVDGRRRAWCGPR